MRVTGNLFFLPKKIFRGPTKGVNPNNSGISKLLKYYVVRCLNQRKRNQLNPITLPRENVVNVVGFCWFGQIPKYPNISAHFERFLPIQWSDWADSFCIGSGNPWPKFIVPTSLYYSNFEIPLFLGLTPFVGTLKIFFGPKKRFPVTLIYLGHHIRYLRIW
jgi:hypothetical protein